MVDLSRAFVPGFEERLARAVAAGVDMMSYMVDADTLRRVIRAAKASSALKEHFIAFLDANVIKGKAHVSCVVLGVAMGVYIEHTADEDVLNIHEDLQNLDKLPYSYANGRWIS